MGNGHDPAGQRVVELRAASVHLGGESMRALIMVDDAHGPVSAPEDALRELRALGDMAVEEGEWPRYFVGTPGKVGRELRAMAGALEISELVVNTIMWDPRKRLESYELLAGEFGL